MKKVKGMSIVNLTGKDIYLQIGEGPEDSICIHAEDIAQYPHTERLGKTAAFEADLDGSLIRIACVEYRPGTLIGLPTPDENTRYIVNQSVFERCPERADLLMLDESAGSAVRDKNGNIVAIRRFLKHAPKVAFPEPGVIEIGTQEPQPRIGQNPYALHDGADDYDPSA